MYANSLYYVAPHPDINVTAINQNIGSQLSLRCDVNTVRGVANKLDIVWLTGGEVIAKYIDSENLTENKTRYTLYYNGSRELTLDDNNTVYQCRVSINNEASNLILNVIDRGECNNLVIC